MASSEGRDTLIVIAFPDFYIYYPNTWHRPISRLLGIFQGEKVLAGHSCILLIDHQSGSIAYYDFGRYSVPPGKGRARSLTSDPELTFDIKAQCSADGGLVNEDQIISAFAIREDLHHGAGPLFYKVIPHVDGSKIADFVEDKIKLGFVPYEIFGRKSLNCSRYIYQLLMAVIPPNRLTTYFKYLCPSATPLDNVMHIDPDVPTVKYHEGVKEVVNTRWIDSITYYFKPRKGYQNNTTRVECQALQWIGSNAIGSYYQLEATETPKHYNLLKYDQSGRYLYSRLFKSTDIIDLDDYSLLLGNSPVHFIVRSSDKVIELVYV